MSWRLQIRLDPSSFLGPIQSVRVSDSVSRAGQQKPLGLGPERLLSSRKQNAACENITQASARPENRTKIRSECRIRTEFWSE